jgi:hypothetical protein
LALDFQNPTPYVTLAKRERNQLGLMTFILLDYMHFSNSRNAVHSLFRIPSEQLEVWRNADCRTTSSYPLPFGLAISLIYVAMNRP